MKIAWILIAVVVGSCGFLSKTTHAFARNDCRSQNRRAMDRVFLPSPAYQLSSATASSQWMASASGVEAIPDRRLVVEGMEAFRRGDIRGSIDKFDASVPAGSKAYLWQRGISYYYNDDFALGSKQFRDDVLRSPLDVEEIVWDIACLLRLQEGKSASTNDGDGFPPPDMMSLPPGKKDRRLIMVRYKP
jgi:hypothetical protein